MIIQRSHSMPRCIRPIAALAVPAAVLAAACTPEPPAEADRVRIDDRLLEPADRQFATQPFDDQVRAGVVRQRTIFDYQFVPGSASLNTLGSRDLGYLADAMRVDGGTIAVRRGQADDRLYAARLDAVRRALTRRGIGQDRVALSDGLAGGAGVESGEALVIREQVRKVPFEIPTGSVLSPTGGQSTVASEIGGS
jgi:hypothetical protein